MHSLVDYAWIGKTLNCIIHNAIVKNNYQWTVILTMCTKNTIHR